MATNYPRLDAISSGDMWLMKNSANDDWRLAPQSVMETWIKSLLTEPVVQRAGPLTGDTLAVSATYGKDTWLIMTPAAALATLTILLPLNDVLADGQEAWVTTTKQITSLTVNGNGASDLYGMPSSMAAESTFKLKYDKVNLAWFNID